MPQEEMSSICKPALRTAFLLTSAMSVVISSIRAVRLVSVYSPCDNLVILIYYASDHIGTANVLDRDNTWCFPSLLFIL